MDTQDIRTLRILEEIEGNHSPSQRYLSDQLNISLGLVNSFLKRLAHKGYFKATSIPRNRVKYILTPKGTMEKSRLTYAFIQHSFRFYRDARRKLRSALKQLENNGTENILFYGTGDLAEIAYLSLLETSIKLSAIVDEDEMGKPFFFFEVQAPEIFPSFANEKILITKIGSAGTFQDKLIKYGVERSNILTFQ